MRVPERQSEAEDRRAGVESTIHSFDDRWKTAEDGSEGGDSQRFTRGRMRNWSQKSASRTTSPPTSRATRIDIGIAFLPKKKTHRRSTGLLAGMKFWTRCQTQSCRRQN